MDRQKLNFAIRDALGHDPEVGTARISITLFEDAVRLEGEVDTLRAKERAAEIVQHVLGGAEGVAVENSLTVGVNRPAIDARLTSLAREMLAGDPLLSKGLGVEVENGIAHLRGQARNMASILHACELLAGITGISEVHRDAVIEERIEVESSDNIYDLDDQSIGDEIAANLDALDPPLADRITVRVNNGVAYLAGEVVSGLDRLKAERSAFKTRGIHRVQNHLIALDGTTGGNEALERQIRARIERPGSAHSAIGTINVMVEGDTAYLFGSTDKPEDVERAGRVAMEVSGIRSVINDIQVADRRKA